MTAGLPQSQEAAGSLYIINLRSSTAPMALEAPDVPGLDGFAVFRSRRIEDGRDRFRLHLGYFESQEQAEGLLPLLRERYPAAWVALAPKDGMGSLDDTSVAHFKLIRQKKAAGGASPRTADAKKASPVPPALADKAAPDAPLPAASSTTESFLKPAEVLRLLETGSPEEKKTSPAVRREEDRPAAAQKFAVQLIWSTQRPDLAKLPRPVVFNAYSLYTVTVQRGPDKWYGLRLGFFDDAAAARQLALYVRSDFKGVSVVPVSERECARAEESVKAAAAKAAARGKEADDGSGGKAAVAVKQTAPKQVPPPRPPSKPADDLLAAKRSIQDALASLDEFQESDPGASGVRHLSVAVVKRKNSVFGKVLSRAAGRR